MSSLEATSELQTPSSSWPPFPEKILNERQEPCEPIRRVHIPFDHVECKVIETTKSPHRDRQKKARSQAPISGKKRNRRENAQDQKKEALGDNPTLASQISHASVKALHHHRNPLPAANARRRQPILLRANSESGLITRFGGSFKG